MYETVVPHARVGIVAIILAFLPACAAHPPTRTPQTSSLPPGAALSPSRNAPDPCLGQTAFEPLSAGTSQSTPARTSLRLLSITPKPGTPIGEGSVLLATFDYSIADFEHDRFRITAQFATTFGQITDSGSTAVPIVPFASGRLRLCLPVRGIWHAEDIRRPFSLRFLLLKTYGGGQSMAVGATPAVSFPALGGPNVTAGPANAQHAYYTALLSVHTTFESYTSYGRYCSAHFKELAPEIAGGLADWSAKYSDTRTRIDTLYTKWMIGNAGGNVQNAQRAMDHLRQLQMRMLADDPPILTRDKCQTFGKFLSSSASDPAVRFPSELKIIFQTEVPGIVAPARDRR